MCVWILYEGEVNLTFLLDLWEFPQVRHLVRCKPPWLFPNHLQKYTIVTRLHILKKRQSSAPFFITHGNNIHVTFNLTMFNMFNNLITLPTLTVNTISTARITSKCHASRDKISPEIETRQTVFNFVSMACRTIKLCNSVIALCVEHSRVRLLPISPSSFSFSFNNLFILASASSARFSV